MAPLETSTTSRPRARRLAICLAHSASATRSRPWPSFVTRLLPTLTTMRRAFSSTEGIGARGCWGKALGLAILTGTEPSIAKGRLHLCFFLGLGVQLPLQVIHDGVNQRLASLARERRNDKG